MLHLAHCYLYDPVTFPRSVTGKAPFYLPKSCTSLLFKVSVPSSKSTLRAAPVWMGHILRRYLRSFPLGFKGKTLGQSLAASVESTTVPATAAMPTQTGRAHRSRRSYRPRRDPRAPKTQPGRAPRLDALAGHGSYPNASGLYRPFGVVGQGWGPPASGAGDWGPHPPPRQPTSSGCIGRPRETRRPGRPQLAAASASVPTTRSVRASLSSGRPRPP